MVVGKVLLWGPMRGVFLISEVPLYREEASKDAKRDEIRAYQPEPHIHSVGSDTWEYNPA